MTRKEQVMVDYFAMTINYAITNAIAKSEFLDSIFHACLRSDNKIARYCERTDTKKNQSSLQSLNSSSETAK
jgi:hypothetical protein